MVVCIKQHLSNIWISIHENVKQHWGEKKRVPNKKSMYIIPANKQMLKKGLKYHLRRFFVFVVNWEYIFHTFCYCLYRRIWTGKRLLGVLLYQVSSLVLLIVNQIATKLS